eukprot:91625-Alexandrium_andersonii.AAC.1
MVACSLGPWSLSESWAGLGSSRLKSTGRVVNLRQSQVDSSRIPGGSSGSAPKEPPKLRLDST